MKRLILAAAVFALSQASLFAADVYKGELFGGYSLANFDAVTAPGWNANYAYNVDSMIGIVADFSGFYASGSKSHTYSGGPQVNFRQDKTTVFGRALFGGVTSNNGGGNGFLMGYGGGVDVNGGDKFDVRIAQFDWMPVRIGGGWDFDVRFAAGVKFHMGGKK